MRSWREALRRVVPRSSRPKGAGDSGNRQAGAAGQGAVGQGAVEQVPAQQGSAGHSPSPAAYPGDFTGTPDLAYAPNPDGLPDPGEIVWTWVPYEEDHAQGKDRPVLIVGRDGQWLLGLMLTSQDHDRDARDEARHGRQWIDIGSGGWDTRGRASEVRVDRVVRVDPATVRREGAVLDRARFEEVADAVRAAR